jgi:precorrin-6B methylase 2
MHPLALLLALVLGASPTRADAPPDDGPRVGLPGKDVIWVPTPEPVIARMLTMARVDARDVVVDLGAGDGRMVIAAARRGARGIGVEYNPDLIAHARRAARRAGVPDERLELRRADLFTADIREATVVMLYLLPEMNLRLRTRLLHLRPGTRIVAHQFAIPEWEPDETTWLGRRAAFLWVVPAQVAGGWRLALPGGRSVDVDLEQTYQRFRGRAYVGPDTRAGLRDTRLRGDEIRFAFVDDAGALHEFVGRVDGAAMAGTVAVDGVAGAWTAARRR